MHFTSSLLTSAFAAVAVAQYNYGSSSTTQDSASSSATTTAGAAATSGSSTVTIQVGQGGLVMDPASTSAAVGDTLSFVFNPGNHSVVQSNFANPCEPLANSVKGSDGFFSGFEPISGGGSTKDFTVKVVDTEPIWYYCAQAQHCKAGMVGVINPPANPSMDISAFKALAASATTNIAPASVVSTVATGSSSSSGSATAATTVVTTASSSKSGAQPTGVNVKEMYAGVVIAGMAAFVMGA